MKQLFRDEAARRRWTERGQNASVAAGCALLLLSDVAWIRADDAGLVEREASSPSIARFELSDAWATVVLDVLILVIVVATMTAPFIGLAWLLHRATRSRALAACSVFVLVAFAGAVAVASASWIGADDITRVEVTGHDVELTRTGLAAHLGLDDALVRRIPLASVGIVDLHHRSAHGDEDHPNDRTVIDLRDGESISVQGAYAGAGDTWQLARTISSAASVDMRCFEGWERQPCNAIEAAIFGSAGG